MSAHNTTKTELISQLFWQMEIGADESLFATPCFKEKKIGLKRSPATLFYRTKVRFIKTKLSYLKFILEQRFR